MGVTIGLRSKSSNAQKVDFGMKEERMNAYEGENNVNFAGNAAPHSTH